MVTTSPTANQTAAPARPQPSAQATEPCLVYQPNVDVCDCGDVVTLVLDMPGASAGSMNVSFEDGVLSLQAKVPPRSLPGRSVVQEYGIGDYRRSFRLGEGFDASQIAAEYRQGVLTIHVPRLAAVRPRKIEVRPA
ncbi:MAG: Hsp20/alpha crystallin family protein [Planctomycetia bacterium]